MMCRSKSTFSSFVPSGSSTAASARELNSTRAGISANKKRSLEAVRIPHSSARQNHEQDFVEIRWDRNFNGRAIRFAHGGKRTKSDNALKFIITITWPNAKIICRFHQPSWATRSRRFAERVTGKKRK